MPSQEAKIAAGAHTPLHDLVERLETATGPDRKIDAAICRLCVPKKFGFAKLRDWPRYTASIDAAITLIPEWLAYQCGCDIDLTPTARVFGHDVHTEEFAASPAIALCIAALKARAAIARATGAAP